MNPSVNLRIVTSSFAIVYLDFQIFQLVIKELPKVLQNKALIQGNDIEALANALFKIFSEHNKSSHLSYKPTTDEFYALVLPAIASLVIYHQSIAPSYQASVTKALSAGIFSGIANVCINTMTTMILEMPETFMRLLPDILLQMSKMSDTTAVAIPVLEFLSSNYLYAGIVLIPPLENELNLLFSYSFKSPIQ